MVQSEGPTTKSPVISRRRFMQVSAAAGAAGLALGTGASASTRRPLASGTSLNVVCEGGGHLELQSIANLFKKQTGHSVNLIELPYQGLYNRIYSELSNGNVTFDVIAGDAIWIPTFANGLLPLNSFFTPAIKADLFPATVQEAQYKGTFYGVPQWTNVEILYYRKDLFENSTEQKNFKSKYGYDLAPPTTWKQFSDAAQFFTRSPSLYGTDVKADVETEYLATVLQAGSPGVVLDSKGKVIIDNAAHLAALEFYSGLNNQYHVAPPGAAEAGWTQAQTLFYDGKTAMTRFWGHLYRQIPTSSSVYGKVGVAPMIAGTAGVAGIPGPFYLSIPKKSPNSALALEFLHFAYAHGSLGAQSGLGLAARISTFKQYENKKGYENYKAMLATLNAPHTKTRPLTPVWQQIVNTVLVPMLQKSVGSNPNFPALLKTAKTQVETIVGYV
ncbi:MAG: extracellular solute-binding protein family 1 [Acidimicrobiaceae bacterium]|nr:extracellular solute-binding protein family 1 [Acidimicrobiaceae bacterium]